MQKVIKLQHKAANVSPPKSIKIKLSLMKEQSLHFAKPI